MSRPGFLERAKRRIAKALLPKTLHRAVDFGSQFIYGGGIAYAGGMASRLTGDWISAGTRSPDLELRYELRILRNRARELQRNSPFMARFHDLVAENVIGPRGMRLQAKNLKQDGTPFERVNTSIEEAWEEWSRPQNCDAAQTLSLPELLSLCVAAWATDGEAVARIIKGPLAGPFGIRIQLLDADYLDELKNEEAIRGRNGEILQNMIRQGVELDQFGAPVAYHIWTRHPADPSLDRERIRVPADEIIHLFRPARPGQHRGVPTAAAVMQMVKMLDGYFEAELVAARTAAASMAAIETPNPEVAIPLDPNAAGTEIPFEVEPGAMLKLNPGEKLSMWDPQHPTAAFPDFTRALLHAIASGLGISYGTLTGDLSQANYSSMRVGMLAERDHWRRLQEFVAVHVLDRIYQAWLPMALLNQRIPAITDFDAARWSRVRWQARGFDWVDPLKEIEGELLEVAAGVNTLTRLAAERGYDFEEILAERRDELATLEKYGVESVLATSITERPNAAEQDTKPADAGATSPKRMRLMRTGV